VRVKSFPTLTAQRVREKKKKSMEIGKRKINRGRVGVQEEQTK